VSRPVVVGVDVGTTSVKAVVVDDTWHVRGQAGEEYPTRYVGATGAEQDPDDWWRATASCVSAALSDAGVASSDVAAVGVSSQAPTVVLLDSDGRPLGPALVWLDRRGQSECARRAGDTDRIVELTGNRPDSYYAAPKLAWLLRENPGLATRAAAMVMANGYVVHRLTGVVSADTTHTGLSLLNDLDAGDWSTELAELWGVPRRWLPPVWEPTAVVGTVRPEAASVTGLAAGTPVIAGLVDGAAASVEAGVVAHGDVCEMTGQSTVVNAAVEVAAARASTGALSVMPYPIPGHHLVFGAMVATGGILRWFRDELTEDSTGDTYAALDALAGTAPLGSGGLVMLPYFLGERSPIWDSDARGAFVGLSLSTSRADLVRAILEGTAYGLAHNLDEMTALNLRPSTLRVVGGGSRGRTWNQIKADVTGVPVEVPAESLGAPVGTALVAAAGVGLLTDLVEVARARYAVGERYEPDPARHAAYRRRYQIYRELYPSLAKVHQMLAELR
jgi:xylulokinase